MKCVVTGGAGFIGSHLCELLLNEGHQVIAYDSLVNGQLSNIEEFKAHSDFNFVEGDLLDYSLLEQTIKGADWVFHLAALADIVPSIEDPTDYYKANVDGTFNILQICKSENIKRFVYAASSSCYGLAEQIPTPETAPISPEYPYALTKNMGEQLVMHWAKVYSLPALSLRLFNVYGPKSRTNGTYGAVFGVFLAQKLNNKPFTVVGDGTQTRDFTYVTDVAKAFYAAAQSDQVGQIYNVGSGNHYSVNRLVELLDGEVVHIPKRPGEPDCTFADITKITSELNWQPVVSFEEGVTEVVRNIDFWAKAPVWEPDSIQEATQSWFNCLDTKVEEKV